MKEEIQKAIEQHLHFQGGTNDKWWLQASIKHYLETGTITGSLNEAIRAVVNQINPTQS